MLEKPPAVEQLEATFQMVLTKHMADVPVINHTLKVKAVGFHQWNNYYLGVLITPWFMNIVLLPIEQDDDLFMSAKVGSIENYELPSGCYSFTLSYEKQLGFYFTCSLFSPMFEFESQQAAELTALESLIALLKTEDDKSHQNQSSDILNYHNGKIKEDKVKEKEPIENNSRRHFLRLSKLSKQA